MSKSITPYEFWHTIITRGLCEANFTILINYTNKTKNKPTKSTYILWIIFTFVFIMEHTVLRYTLGFQVVRRKRIMERVEGIEPSPPGRKHGILPLNYTRVSNYIILYYKKKINNIIYFFLVFLFFLY